MAKRKQEDPPKGSPAWMSTFSDLMNLLLCFFVLLFSMSTVDAEKFELVVQSLQSTFSILPSGGSTIGEGELISSGVSMLEKFDVYFNSSSALPKGDEEPEDEEESDQEEEQEQEEGWEQAHPESITSLCYSCQRYADCNVKTGTCENCDQYVNKAEAEKTDEQRYDEEQAAIDRETARKLREQEQEEKMNNLPSDSREEKEYIRLSTDTFEDVIAGRRPYLILKNDKIRTGMIVSALEFMQGRATGRELALKIVCMDDAGTSSALEDGYCVVGIRQQEILKEAGADAAEYADQSAMQYGA